MISEEIHHSTTNEYCIIFGNSLQAEHLFLAGCYFYTQKKERKMIMWVEERKTGFKFVERYTDPMTGKTRRVSVVMEKNTAQSRKLAAVALSEKIDKALLPQAPKLTLKELVDLYASEQLRTVKQSTYKRNCGARKSIMKILGADTLVEKLNAGYIRERFLATGRTPGTMNEWMTRLKALLRWGYRNDYISSIAYLDKIERFKDVSHRKKIEDKFLESAEVKKLLDGMNIAKWKVLTEFLVLSGLRFGEAAALERSDIDLKKREILVSKNYDCINDLVTTPKTDYSIRDVYIQDELLKTCKNALLLSQSDNIIQFSNFLFPGTVQEHVDYYAYAKYLRETSLRVIGRKITPHALRHTHASLLMEQGVDIDSISKRLGHNDSHVTREIYLHVTKKLEAKRKMQLKEVKVL